MNAVQVVTFVIKYVLTLLAPTFALVTLGIIY